MDKKKKQEIEERHEKLFKALAKDTIRKLTLITNKSRLKPYLYGQQLDVPLCGKHFKLPTRSSLKPKPILNVSLSYIPIYRHIEIYDLADIESHHQRFTCLKDQADNFRR